MPILRTASGKEYVCDFMGVANGVVLYVQLMIDYYELLNVFTLPEETNTLSWIGSSGDVIETEIGFTEFGGFTVVGGQCPIRLRMLKKIEVISDAN